MGEHDFRYIETDIPPGMTLDEWRRRRPPAPRRRRPRLALRRLRRRSHA